MVFGYPKNRNPNWRCEDNFCYLFRQNLEQILYIYFREIKT